MQNRIVGVIGPTGSGKTTWTAHEIATRERVAVFSPANDPAYYTGSPNIVVCEDVVSAIREMPNKGDFHVVLDSEENVKAVKRGDSITLSYFELDEFINACYQCGNMTMVLDEAHDLCTRQGASFALLRAARRGRHSALSIIWVSQRFQTIHTSLTGNSHEYIFCAGIKEPLDLRAIYERCGDETVSAIRRLPKYGHVHWTEESGLGEKVSLFPVSE